MFGPILSIFIWCWFGAFKAKKLKKLFSSKEIVSSHAYNLTMEKALVKIIFGRKIFICQPIFKFFVALFTIFGMPKDDKITVCRKCFKTR